MTREQIITRVKHNSMYIDDRETADYIINALEQQPCDCVSLGVYKQVMRERDIAIEQLKELGYEFGEKIRTSDDCVSRTQALKELKESAEHHANDSREEVLLRRDRDIIRALPPVTPTHGTCKDCFYYNIDEDGHGYHCEKYGHTRFPVYADFYCKDFEKEGKE